MTVPNIANKMGKGWTQVSSNTLGEFLLRTYLEEHVTESRAKEAAAGWGGDRYSLLSGPVGERLLLVLLTWDAFEDSSEFFTAYQFFMDTKTKDIEGATSEAVGKSGRKWITADDTTFVGQVGPAILLIIGDTEEIVQDGLTFLFEALEGPAP